MVDGNSPPLTPAGFQVLLALASGRAHGYAIMGFIADLTHGAVQLGPGTLYRTLARLAADGLVTEAPDASEDEPHDARRRYYRITPEGRRTAVREAALLGLLLVAAADAGLLDETDQAETA